MQGIHFLVEKHCEICGKLFFPTEMWIYKIREPMKRTYWYCSYTCFNKGKEQYEIARSKNRKRRRFSWRNGY